MDDERDDDLIDGIGLLFEWMAADGESLDVSSLCVIDIWFVVIDFDVVAVIVCVLVRWAVVIFDGLRRNNDFSTDGDFGVWIIFDSRMDEIDDDVRTDGIGLGLVISDLEWIFNDGGELDCRPKW